MKIAILADIHGNKRGLETVVNHIENWEPDTVVVNGDIVNRGPSNLECWDFIWQKHLNENWKLVRGNHEEFLLSFYAPKPLENEKSHGLNLFALWAWEQIKHRALEMAQMPDRQSVIAPDGTLLLVTHASNGSSRQGIFPRTEDDELRLLTLPGPAVFVTSHTHRPFVRHVDQTLVVNTGSAGLPFDDDPRASYAQVTWSETSGWSAEIIRLDYDREAAQMDLVTSGFLDEGGPFAQLVLVEYRLAIGMIQRWHRSFNKPYFETDIDLETSVAQMLASEQFRDHTWRPGSR